MSNTQDHVKETVLLTLAIDLESLELVSKVIRFPNMTPEPFDGEISLPVDCLESMKSTYEEEIALQKKLAREIKERKVIEKRRKEARKKDKKAIPGQKPLFEEDA